MHKKFNPQRRRNKRWKKQRERERAREGQRGGGEEAKEVRQG